MEINEEFIEKHGLSEDQVKAFNELHSNELAEAKKTMEEEFKGVANTNAEKILAGAAEKVEKETGIERKEGEKLADYFTRSGVEHLATKQTDLDAKQKEIDDKLEEISKGDGNKELAEQLESLKTEKDDLLKKVADYDKIKETADKYPELEESNSKLKLEVSFTGVMPVVPEGVNQFEFDAKWKTFKEGVLKTHRLEIVDGKAIAIDKENEHKRIDLLDLLGKDEPLKELLAGRQIVGSGAKPNDKTVSIEGLPFEILENADPKQRAEAIRTHMATLGIKKTDKGYVEKFKEFNDKILAAKQT